MSKLSALAEELAELRRCGEVLISISETLSQMFGSTDSAQSEQTAAEPQHEAPAPAPEAKPEQVKTEKSDTPRTLTLEEVRPILAEKSRAGHTATIRELLKKHGSPNLSGIDPAEYPALLAEVEAL